MRLKEFDIKLDIKQYNESEAIEVVQGDNYSNVLNITLTDGTSLYNLTGTEVKIAFSRADKTTVEQTDVVILNEDKGSIQCVLSTDTISIPGKVLAEVIISKENTRMTTSLFDFYVRKSIY